MEQSKTELNKTIGIFLLKINHPSHIIFQLYYIIFFVIFFIDNLINLSCNLDIYICYCIFLHCIISFFYLSLRNYHNRISQQHTICLLFFYLFLKLIELYNNKSFVDIHCLANLDNK